MRVSEGEKIVTLTPVDREEDEEAAGETAENLTEGNTPNQEIQK